MQYIWSFSLTFPSSSQLLSNKTPTYLTSWFFVSLKRMDKKKKKEPKNKNKKKPWSPVCAFWACACLGACLMLSVTPLKNTVHLPQQPSVMSCLLASDRTLYPPPLLHVCIELIHVLCILLQSLCMCICPGKCIWKMPFPWSCPPPLALIIFLSPFPHRSLRLKGRGVIKTSW